MSARHITALSVAALAALTFAPGHASAAPIACGGNSHQLQAPVTCVGTKTIDGTVISVTITVTAGGFLTSHFHLSTPRNTDTLIHTTSHTGFSVNGPAVDPTGVIPAGQQDGTLTIPQALCGQVDNRAVFDNKSGRVSGPWINNDSCSDVGTTTTTAVPATTTPSVTSSVPVTGPPSSGPTASPPASATPTTGVGGTLPPTGTSDTVLIVGGIVLMIVGGAIVILGRRWAKS